MANFMTVFSKELSDHFGSKRFLLLFILIIALSTVSAYQGATSVKSNLGSNYSVIGYDSNFISIFSGAMGGGFSFMTLMFIFGPIVGLSMGFDAISKERTSGSLSVILSQPIFRDSIINGKFLAGLTALALMIVSTIGIMVGIAIPIVGFGPTLSEITRIIMFTLLTILYLGFWLALSLLFSTAFKKTTTSILATISTWIFFSFAITIIASLIATVLVPVPASPYGMYITGNQTGGFTMPDQSLTEAYSQANQRRMEMQNLISDISPANLYSDASYVILREYNPSSFFSRLNVDMWSTWPQIAAIGAGLVICFVAAYAIFLRREIRAGG